MFFFLAFAPLLITLGLLYPVAAMIRYIVLEKELRQKELMLMMSVTESDIGWAWFLSFFYFHLVTAAIATVITTQLFESSEGFFLWLFWEFTFLAIINFSMFISAFFTQATRACLIGLLIVFVGYFLTLIVDIETGSPNTINLISLHPIACFSYGLQEISRLEDLGVGLTSSTIDTTDAPSGYTFSNTIENFIGDIIIWGVLAWYCNRVVPSGFGAPRPWYFPFTPAYWCPSSIKGNLAEGVVVEEPSSTLKDQMQQGKGIQIRNLHKTFGDKTAVAGLSMEIFSNQITALLGHNGAGTYRIQWSQIIVL
jgi:ABC-type multidrug transport system fused ATPase/permease subunit